MCKGMCLNKWRLIPCYILRECNAIFFEYRDTDLALVFWFPPLHCQHIRPDRWKMYVWTRLSPWAAHFFRKHWPSEILMKCIACFGVGMCFCFSQFLASWLELENDLSCSVLKSLMELRSFQMYRNVFIARFGAELEIGRYPQYSYQYLHRCTAGCSVVPHIRGVVAINS